MARGIEVPQTILVNPSFEVLDPKEVEDWEGCLSVPFLAARVPRAKKVRVRALSETGKLLDFVAEDFHARVVLHESDHLDGVIYLDRVKDRASIRYTVDF
ncbi:MAG: peptide deformylase [Holophagales bacterium]|nr:peptide deformylase [Holophagales bacterium]